jgi:hypothetical protein
MTDSDGTAAAAPRKRDFGGFLFWYVAIAIFAATAFILAVTAISFVGDYFLVLVPQEWAAVWTLLLLLLCVKVASAHNLGFWRGFGGWFVGNILGSIAFLPIAIVARTAFGGTARGFYSLLALWLLYAVGSAVAMIWKRRRAARALWERGLLRVFE